MTKNRFKIVKSKLIKDGWVISDKLKQFTFPTLKGDKRALTSYCKALNDLYEENESLKKQIGNLEHTRDFCADVCADCERLEKENEQLKQQISRINQLIDKKIDEFKNGDYGDLPCNTIHMFLDLKQEIGDVE